MKLIQHILFTTMIVIPALGSICYLAEHNIKLALYWALVSALNATVASF